MWKSLLKAAKFAKKAHGTQKRAHGTPYYHHPMAVARILWNQGTRQPSVMYAAFLHDTMEDCGETHESIQNEFGFRVAELVTAVTKKAGEGYDEYYTRVKAAGDLAVALKRADRQHNNSELHLLPPEKEQTRVKALKKTQAMERAFAS